MKTLTLLLISAVLLAGSQSQSSQPKFYCFQDDNQGNQIFESSFLNCARGKEDGSANLKKMYSVCVENVFCAAETEGFKSMIENYSKKKFSELNQDEIVQDLYMHDKKTHSQNAVTSYLMCESNDDGKTCPSPADCQKQLFYNLQGTETKGSLNSAAFPNSQGTHQ